MSALDSSFLALEDGISALHIGSVGVFDGPAPPFSSIRDEIAAKLHRVPRYRQRMRPVPGRMGRPVWQDDPEFDLVDHLHRTALPHPGGDHELQDLVGQIMSRPIDHEHPLWENWVVEGLADGRWAVVTKVHHSMVDGIAGTDLMTTMFGSQASGDDDADGWTAEPARRWSQVRLVADAFLSNARESADAARATVAALAHPRSLVSAARAATDGLAHFLTAVRPVAHSSLVGPLGADRSYRWAEVPLSDVLALRSTYGCTVNDVVLAAVSAAFRDLLLSRGEQPTRRSVRTLVPVSVRHADQRGDLDNRVSAILVDLPVDQSDPVAALEVVADRMRRLKASHEAEAGELVTALGNLVPPPGLAAGLQLAFRLPQRVLTTVTTNVPGPREELSLAGRRMISAYPYVPIADRIRTGIAVTSYDGNLLFGITADRRSTPDIDRLRDGLLRGFEELAHRADTREEVP